MSSDDPPDAPDTTTPKPNDAGLMTARPPPGAGGSDVYSASTVAGPASTDLLDLVRDAEEAAKVGTLGKTATPPSSASKFHAAAAAPQVMAVPRTPGQAFNRPGEYVDVDDEAIDAPPSLPPMRSAAPPAHARATASRSSRPPPPAFDPIEPLVIPPLRPVALEEDAPKSAARVRSSSVVPRQVDEVARSPVVKTETIRPGLPPIAAILLLFALAIGALVIIVR